MPQRKYISLIFSPDGGEQSFSFRLHKWQLWALLGAAVIGWILLMFGVVGAIFFARFAANERALVAENSRLRLALTKADSLQQELDEMRSMRQLMERALLVAQKKQEGTKYDSQQNTLQWLMRSSVFNTSAGLPELTKYLDDLKRRQAYIPSGLPAEGVITAKFGETGGIFKTPHSGVDILEKVGTPVKATAEGVIAKVGRDNELGIFIEIDHLNGYRTIYAHLSDVVVSAGDPIRKGDVIGHSGETGKARNPHIHYEVRYAGKPIDPLKIEETQQKNSEDSIANK